MNRSSRATIVALINAALCVVALLGCSSNTDENASASQVEASDVILCGTYAGTAVDGTTTQHARWFYAAGINQKLELYPDLAAQYGRNRVATCDDAESFVTVYDAFSEAHPGFDAEQPFVSRGRPPIPDPTKMPEVSEEKIKGGASGQLPPVVRLSTTVQLPGNMTDPKSCTGTMISKNWIITAAHCLNIMQGGVLGTTSYRQFLITWADANGRAGRSISVPYVLQYVSPGYLGDFKHFPKDRPGADFALLYISAKEYDGFLPRGTPGAGDFMRLSDAGFGSSSSVSWGWGLPDTSGLFSMPLAPLHGAVQSTTDLSSLSASIPIGYTGPYLCRGDSGGPMIDKFAINDPDTGQQLQIPAEVASLVGGQLLDDSDCVDLQLASMFWARIDQQIHFITAAMQEWYGPNFNCARQPESGTEPHNVLTCWGTPCMADSPDCAPDEFCSQAGPSFLGRIDPKLCPDGTANCMYGQCLPKNGAL